jgi:membrane protein
MTASKIVKYITKIKQQIINSVHKINEFSRGWLWMLANATKETLKPETAINAAAIAYFALFAIFPITLLSISIASGPSIDQSSIIQKIEFIAPTLSQLLGQNIDEIIKARGPVTSIALIGLIWSASTVFYTFTHTLNEIWGGTQRRAAWRRRGLSILLVLIFVGPALFLASFAGSAIAHVNIFLPEQIFLLAGSFSLVIAILIDIILFMVLYMILPHGASSWREILPGAITAGFLWELAKKVFLSFVFTYVSASNMVYGSVTTIITFLVWAYLSSLIFLFGAFLSVSYFQYKKGQKEIIQKKHE